MANNRLYIRCLQCGEGIAIGKHFAGALHQSEYDGVRFLDLLNEFYAKHCYCGERHYELELCEDFPIEMTNNPISIDDDILEKPELNYTGVDTHER